MIVVSNQELEQQLDDVWHSLATAVSILSERSLSQVELDAECIRIISNMVIGVVERIKYTDSLRIYHQFLKDRLGKPPKPHR